MYFGLVGYVMYLLKSLSPLLIVFVFVLISWLVLYFDQYTYHYSLRLCKIGTNISLNGEVAFHFSFSFFCDFGDEICEDSSLDICKIPLVTQISKKHSQKHQLLSKYFRSYVLSVNHVRPHAIT